MARPRSHSGHTGSPGPTVGSSGNRPASLTAPVGAARGATMLAALRTRGLRLTPQRAAVVRELATDESHPTAQELFDRLRGNLPTMSFATVYNTLDVLRRSDLCSALALSPGSGRFDPNVLPHDHLVCDRCGMVRDLSPAETPPRKVSAPRDGGAAQSSRLAAVAPHFRLRAVEQVFRGLCGSCAALSGLELEAPSPGSPSPPGPRRQARAPRARSRGRARA